MSEGTKKPAMRIWNDEGPYIEFELRNDIAIEESKQNTEEDWLKDEKDDFDRYGSLYTWNIVNGRIDTDLIPSVESFNLQLKERYNGQIGMDFQTGSNLLMEMPFDDVPRFIRGGEHYCGTVYEPYSYSYMGDDEFLIFDYKDHTYVMKCEPNNGANTIIRAFKVPKKAYYQELNRIHGLLGVDPVVPPEK